MVQFLKNPNSPRAINISERRKRSWGTPRIKRKCLPFRFARKVLLHKLPIFYLFLAPQVIAASAVVEGRGVFGGGNGDAALSADVALEDGGERGLRVRSSGK